MFSLIGFKMILFTNIFQKFYKPRLDLGCVILQVSRQRGCRI